MNSIGKRKLHHIEACLDWDVNFRTQTTGFELMTWPYCALPEISLASIKTNTKFMGHNLRAPILIGAMTGGAELAQTINKNLAIAAETLGLGMMLGSQRVMLEDDSALKSFKVRQHAPNILLIGNLGVAQLNRGYGANEARRAVKLVKADGLAFHTNPLQEALQFKGDKNFSEIIPKLESLVPELEFPVMLKEVGQGISGKIAKRIKNIGLAALDVAGSGGTNWARVEALVRFGEKNISAGLEQILEIGIPTALALRECKKAAPKLPLVASGGIRSGLDIAKALAMGASAVAIARPLLRPATQSPEAVMQVLTAYTEELRLAMYATGARNLEALLKL